MPDQKSVQAALANNFISIEDEYPYYCEVNVSSAAGSARGLPHQPVTTTIGGILTICAGKISLRLVRFDEHFEVQEDDRLEARSEANWVASFFDIVPMGTGQWGMGEKAAYNASVLVNTAVVGWDVWSVDDRARLTRFCVTEADIILRHWPTYERLANNSLSSWADPTAFEVTVEGGRVRVFYTAFADMNSKYPQSVWPVVEMDFDEGVTLGGLCAQTRAFISFLSAAASKILTPRQQVVSKFSCTELLEHPERAEHSIYVYEHYKSLSMQRAPSCPYDSFVLLADDNERSAFVACLRSWFDRYSEWEQAASAMMEAFALQGVMGSERLLNATKWIEVTPTAKVKRAILKEHIKEISDVLNQKAKELGYRGIFHRLKNCLSNVANEKNVQRFLRLSADLKAFYGEDIVGDDLAEWVTEAFRWRGMAAHRPIIYRSEAERTAVYMAICAAECFAYLMLLRELPMSKEGKMRVAEAPLVRAYTGNIKGHSPRNFAGS